MNAYEGFDFRNDNDLWQKVIFFNRTSCIYEHRALLNYEEYKKAQYFLGPVCKNPKDTNSYSEVIGFDDNNSVQLCIVCKKLALEFSDLRNIDSVIFCETNVFCC